MSWRPAAPAAKRIVSGVRQLEKERGVGELSIYQQEKKVTERKRAERSSPEEMERNDPRAANHRCNMDCPMGKERKGGGRGRQEPLSAGQEGKDVKTPLAGGHIFSAGASAAPTAPPTVVVALVVAVAVAQPFITFVFARCQLGFPWRALALPQILVSGHAVRSALCRVATPSSGPRSPGSAH